MDKRILMLAQQLRLRCAMHLPGCTVPPLVDWLSGTVALASGCYGHPETWRWSTTPDQNWQLIIIVHQLGLLFTMSVPLYTSRPAEP